MSYTAIDQMRRINRKRFGEDLGPHLPKPFAGEKKGMNLKSAVLRFLDRRCTGLRHDSEKEKAEQRDRQYYGRSLRPGQIPYNMQMDLDRLCLKNEIARFIDSGVAEDAYTVYYAFIEMFIGEGGKSQSMVELLSEFESNASSLLMSHRDHYSHSVYVFALGLAIYETNPWFRQVFARCYGFRDDGGYDGACAFLEYWGLTALFHDIGYPFEIPFEQILAYFEVDRKKRGPGSVFIAYRNVDPLTRIEAAEREKLKALYGGREFKDITELLAAVITEKLGATYGFTEETMDHRIRSKACCPEENNYFMDHAYFSATRLYREIENSIGIEKINEKIKASEQEIERLEEQIRKLQLPIEEVMSENSLGFMSTDHDYDYQFEFQPGNGRALFDQKTLKAEMPDVWEKYKKPAEPGKRKFKFFRIKKRS